MAPPIVTLIAMGSGCMKELELALFSLEQHYAEPPLIYLLTDSASVAKVPRYGGEIKVRASLDAYSGLGRNQMCHRKGKIYKDLWTEFMCEKIAVMRWAMDENPGRGVWFLDADISLLAPLPEIPAGVDVALSPHYIRKADEAKYGRYNGGLVWCAAPRLLDVWAAASHRSRYHEQAALEQVASAAERLHELPIQINFSWWRVAQAEASAAAVRAQLTSAQGELLFQGLPLQSIHTHWNQRDGGSIGGFNADIWRRLAALGTDKSAAYCAKLSALFGWR